MHKQYLLIKGRPKELTVETEDTRIYIKIRKDDDKPFVIRVPSTQKNFIKILVDNGYEILERKNAIKVRKYITINGHVIKVYGADLLVEIKADTEEELFKESKAVRDTLKTKYGIESQDKCKWICFR